MVGITITSIIGCLQSYVAEDGSLVLLADRQTMKQDLLSLDLEQAHSLTELSGSRSQQVRSVCAAALHSPAHAVQGIDIKVSKQWPSSA